MARTRSTTTIKRGEIGLEIATMTPVRGRGRVRGRGVALARDYKRNVSPELAIKPKEQQVPPKYAAVPLV